jgi:hypothetical protein
MYHNYLFGFYYFRKELQFTKTQHLYNPWNEGKPVKIGRDGQVGTTAFTYYFT